MSNLDYLRYNAEFTTKHIANALTAGIKANFNPDNQQTEIDKLADMLIDMAMALDFDAEDLGEQPSPKKEQLHKYSDLLQILADYLETSPIQTGCQDK